ncbi:HNH endonuclease [anaerobic digester metagenome]
MDNIKPIPNYDGYYASDTGWIYSYRSGGQRILSQRIHKGYYRVNLKNKKSKSGFSTEPVHKLVLETFVGARPEGMLCRHLNGNALDNRLINLCWGTPKQNAQDSIRHGTAVCLRHGERANASKLLLTDIYEIKRLYQNGYLQRELAEQFGVTQRHISDIVRNKTWCHSFLMGDVKSSPLS